MKDLKLELLELQTEVQELKDFMHTDEFADFAKPKFGLYMVMLVHKEVLIETIERLLEL